MCLEIPQQMPVQEFGPVVAIEAFDGEREGLLDRLDLPQDAGGTFVPGRTAFGPAGEQIGHGQAPDEIAGQTGTTMGDGVGLDKPRLRDVPSFTLQGDLLAQQRPWLGPGQAMPTGLGAHRGQKPIDRGWRDGEQLGACRIEHGTMGLFVVRQPERKCGAQALGGHLVGG